MFPYPHRKPPHQASESSMSTTLQTAPAVATPASASRIVSIDIIRGAVLIIRGLWLILLELTILRLAWTFNFDFAHYEMAGVIWVIGCCMILMAALVKLPLPVSAAIGIIIIAAHNLMDPHIGKLLEGMDGNQL